MFGAQQGRPANAGRRTLRERKVSQRMAVVDESTRQQAVQARLDALEADNEVGDDTFALNSDDDDFIIAQDDDEEEEEVEISGKRKRPAKKGGGAGPAPKRKLRTGVTGGGSRLPRTFARLLEDAQLDKLPAGTPSYLTAQVAPAKSCAPRRYCTVCGNTSSYTCARCGSRYCSRKCHNTHVETRCLKFIT